jgi:hypothetical protein
MVLEQVSMTMHLPCVFQWSPTRALCASHRVARRSVSARALPAGTAYMFAEVASHTL